MGAQRGHGTSVEAKGLDNVMSSFDMHVANGAKYYQLWQGSTLKITYDEDDIAGTGQAMLEDMLRAAEAGGGKAAYTLRFYKRLGKGDQIDSQTAYCASFNFKLNDDTQIMPYQPGPVQPAGRSSTADMAILQKLEELNQRLNQIEMESANIGDIPEEDPIEKYSKILEIPVVERVVMGAINFFSQYIPNNMSRQPRGGGLAGVEDTRTQVEQVNDACARLFALDPQLGTHLQMLAKLAEDDIDIYEMALKKLKKQAANL